MEMKIGEGLKKVLLMGIGAAAVTAEKSQQLVDELVKRGELTVEQGKELNQELKRNVKKSLDDMTQAAEDVEVTADEKVVEFEDKIAGMTVEELEKLKAFIEKAEESIKSGE
jgi:polyhydroxyalkanoate synthesis regulator phasin